MLYLILLLVFLIQFLVILGALLLVIFTARPEVPISGNGMKERTALRDHPSPRPPAGKPPTPDLNRAELNFAISRTFGIRLATFLK